MFWTFLSSFKMNSKKTESWIRQDCVLLSTTLIAAHPTVHTGTVDQDGLHTKIVAVVITVAVVSIRRNKHTNHDLLATFDPKGILLIMSSCVY